jgi:hypothetical protein
MVCLCCFLALAPAVPVYGQALRTTGDRLLAPASPDMLFQQSLVPDTETRLKDPKKAFLFSALAPGAGEMYAGYKRGLFLTALEIGGIAGYVLLHRRGDERKRQVIAFAEAHWDSARCAPECLDPLVGTEQLGTYGSQQYYEQIGKYNKFQEGWDDYNPSASGLSPNRQLYVAMRHNMNGAYKWATWSAGMLMINHTVSAIHAALLVRRDNRAAAEQSRIRIRVEGFASNGSWRPYAGVLYTF